MNLLYDSLYILCLTHNIYTFYFLKIKYRFLIIYANYLGQYVHNFQCIKTLNKYPGYFMSLIVI